MTDVLTFAQLDHTELAVSDDIAGLLRRSYAVEAELIGAEDFPPLRRSAGEIREARTVFCGLTREGLLVAVAEIEREIGAPPNIASFVVHPSAFRRGIGSRLLHHVLEVVDGGPVTVSTAAANHAAIRLYEKHGFRITMDWAIGEIRMVTMKFGE